jgi:hypothetical protein
MRELFDEGLIYFFSVDHWGDINEAADDPNPRLDDAQVEAEMRSEWWRSPLGSPLPEGHPNIWIAPTPKGEAAANEPPDEIRRLWASDLG